MRTRINRETFLQELESVQPGLAPRGLIQQSSCFVFKEGYVITFNDEVACRHRSSLQLTGAVEAAPLLAILHKLKETELVVWMKKGKLYFKGKRKTLWHAMEKEIHLPVDTIERPKKWTKLRREFTNALAAVQACASKDESETAKVFVHIHKDWIEASDNYHMARYVLRTKIKQPILSRRDAIKNIIEFGMTRFSETDTWVHFKNPSGLILSCKRYAETYPDLTRFYDVKGARTTLPKGLGSAAENAGIFSKDNDDDNLVLVEIRPGEITIKGEGDFGGYTQPLKTKYKGEPLSFMVTPEILIELTKNHSTCQLTEKFLAVDTGNYKYVTRLTRVEKSK